MRTAASGSTGFVAASAVRQLSHLYDRLLVWLSPAVACVVAAMLLVLVGLLCFQAAQGALKFGESVQWIQPVAQMSLVPLGWLGAALAVRTHGHQGVDLIGLAWKGGRRYVDSLVAAVVLIFGVCVCWFGGAYFLNQLDRGAELGVPVFGMSVGKWVFYTCYPVAGALIALFSVGNLFAPWLGDSKRDDATPPAAPPASEVTP